MARKAPTRRRPQKQHQQINKAISPNLMQSIQQSPRGMQPRRYGLMDAMNAATAAQNVGWWDLRPMPRDPLDETAFGPNNPLLPQPIDPVRPDTGRPEPRVWEYPTSWNLPGNSRREVPWQVLRASSTGVDIIRRCVEARKKHVRTLRWAWTVRADVVEDAYNSDTKSGYEQVAQRLREEHAAEIRRLTEFWRQPWKCAPGGPWGFGQWINSLMEEHLVLDAIAVYPRLTVGGDLFALEQVDGSTIKPLLDWRGSQPLPPHPAYQQELYGFPRGEYAATVTVDADGNEVVENPYMADELFYYRENARLFSPYGFSAVEQSLISARLYLKRQGWMLAEYDDGSTPLTFLEPPADPALNADFTPTKRRMWEESFNGEYAGQTAARHRAKVLPPGWQPHQMKMADEQFKPDYDLHLIKLVAGHFGMTATELGFSENQGLGSAGWQEGQAEVQGRVGLKPDVEVLSDIINSISGRFLHSPAELEFTFIDPANENDAESDGVADSQLKRGTIVLNDDRRRLKLPLYDFPEADMPMLVGVGTAGYVFIDGAKQAADDAAAAAVKAQEATADGATGKLELEQAKLDDGKQARQEERDFQRETRDSEQEFAREQADTTKAASPDGAHTGAMIALVPTEADAARLAADGGETADQLHLTLRHLGKGADFPEHSRQHLIENVREYFKGVSAFTAKAFNVAVFNPDGDEPCIVLGVGGDMVETAYRKVDAAIEDYGADLPEPHKPFIPHITLAYTDDVSTVEELVDRVGPITFDRVRVAFAGEVTDISLSDPATIAKAAAAELHAFANWRRRNPGTPRRPFLFKAATPDDLEDPPGPDVVSFGPGWEWVEDLEKYESWWPRDSRGRWVKRSHMSGPLLDALRDLDKPGRHVTDSDIRNLDDSQLFDFFSAMSRRRQLDEPLIHRLLGDMDRRERNTPFAGLGDEELTDEQRRVDQLVAGGRALEANFAQAVGGSSRRKQFAQRVDAQIRRGAQHRDNVLRLERELESLRRQRDRPEPPPLDLSRLPSARFIRTDVGWYEVVKVNRATVKVKVRPGMDDLIKIPKILEIREDITKAAAGDEAGGADPKEPTPPPDQRWPGWLMDTLIAAAVTEALISALTAGLTIGSLLAALQQWAGPLMAAGGGMPNAPTPDVNTWLHEHSGLPEQITEAITPPIRQAHIEGWLVGERSAQALLDWVEEHGDSPRNAVEISVNWGDWEPGHPEAARLLIDPGGLQRLLAQSGITIKRIAAHRLDQVGRIIGEGLRAGDTPDQIARRLLALVNDPAWARRVAITETNRAMSAAAAATYEDAGIWGKGWMTALDQRVCKLCERNERHPDGSLVRVPLGALFPSGDPWPPGHPHCRCALVPVFDNEVDLLKAAMTWQEWNALHPERRRNSRGQWGRGHGTALDADNPLAALDWLTDDEDDGFLEGEAAPPSTSAWGQPMPKPAAPPRGPATTTGQRMPAGDLFDATDETVRLIGAQQAYEGNFGGYTTAVVDVFRAPHIFQVKGNIYDPDGKQVGNFDRMLVRDRGPRGNRDGQVYAVHALLELDRDHQGQGFAEAFNAHLTGWYRESGLDRVTLTANIDVGGYAWARNGYDWADKNAPKSIIRNLKLHAQLDSGTIPADRLAEQQQLAREMLQRFQTTKFGAPDYPTPYEVSQLGRWPGAGRDDWWIGKRAMWGATWEGVKPL